MGAPSSLLQGARAFARDFPRDQMPKGYLWDCEDYVPNVIDASLTGRGGWRWGSDVLPGDAEVGILAVFTTGDQLLVWTNNNQTMQINPNPPYNTIANRGSHYRSLQNPIQKLDQVVLFDMTGTGRPIVYTPTTAATCPPPAPIARVGCIWGGYVVCGGVPGLEDAVYFSHPTNDLLTAGGWDALSVLRTSGRVTALAALRSVILVFHPGSTERIRGSVPPNSTTAEDDLSLEPLFSRAGCPDPKAIAYWNENVIFADEHGVHLTDGAIIRNLISQGGLSSFWRPLYQTRTSLSANTFLDYYMITLGTASGPVTLICDLNKRQWFRFTNLNAISMIASGGSIGMERIWAGVGGTNRLARVGTMFFPAPAGQISDDNGVIVLPSFETPWYRLGEEGRKRIRFAYLSYDARVDASMEDGLASKSDEFMPTVIAPAAAGPVLDVGYIRSPQMLTYTSLGVLPYTTQYSRFRLPLGQFPYGVAFRVKQTQPSTVTRIFDLAVEAQAAERSRV